MTRELTREEFEKRIGEIANDPRPAARLGLFGDLLDTDAALRTALAQAQEDKVKRDEQWRDDVVALRKYYEAKLAAMEKELHDAKTQCGKNAISHMTQYHRADSLQQQLAKQHALSPHQLEKED